MPGSRRRSRPPSLSWTEPEEPGVRSTLDEFTNEFLELRALVSSIAPVNAALAGHPDSVVRQYLTVRRRFDYAAFIVALYASFEKFSENLVASYARLAALRSKYEHLPISLTRKHMLKSADILARGRLGEGRYVGVREIDLVKNLFECLSGATPYSLNDVAVIAHDLNLRAEELGKLFASVGIEKVCERSRRADALLAWFCAVNGLAEAPRDGVPPATIQQRLDDLVERRNQVAHRGGNPLNLLGTAEMGDLVDFVEALAMSVFGLTAASYLRTRYLESKSLDAEELRLIAGPLKSDRNVVVVGKPAKRLYVGQPIFTFVDSCGARWGRIRELQLEGVAATVVEQSSTAAEVGVRIDFKCPSKVVLFVLDADDDVVWGLDPTATASAASAAAAP
jgi:hypothetical protein